jgi:hypothetical protein
MDVLEHNFLGIPERPRYGRAVVVALVFFALCFALGYLSRYIL